MSWMVRSLNRLKVVVRDFVHNGCWTIRNVVTGKHRFIVIVVY